MDYSATKTKTNDISYTAFMKHVQQDEVQSVSIKDSAITGKLKDGRTFSTVAPQDASLIPTLRARDVEIKAELPPEQPWWPTVLSTVLPIILILGLWFLMMNQNSGGSRMVNFGKSNARRYDDTKNPVKFKDVAGAEEAKQELEEVVDFLKHPDRYNTLGAKIPKGVLLYGPPGTGKTLLARAVAGEAGVPFFSISGSDFVEMFVGVGASRVRDLFQQAKKNAPCIIFIDEIDAVARRRSLGSMSGAHDEREQTLNQLLVEMDGFGTNEGIIVMAATNRVDILDPAILRPGRFDRKVVVGRPDVREREEILRVHAANKPLGSDVDLSRVARTTAGFTGADLENLMNEAAILTAKEHRLFISQSDIDRSFVRVGVGEEKKSHLISDREKRITAFHESGHAILMHELPDVGDVHTISIIPTGTGAAGYTMPLPKEGEMFRTKGEMEQQIVVALGGRAAEKLVFDDITTGASQDIRSATELARDMVKKYGMSDSLGPIDYEDGDDTDALGFSAGRSYSEATAAQIDREIGRIMAEAGRRAEELIGRNKEVLYRCADLLMEKEKIGTDEFNALFQEAGPSEQP